MDGKLYCYSRRCRRQRLLVLCSFSDKNMPLRIPEGFDLSKAELILQNYDAPAEKFLQPYETRVYLWKN